MASTLIRDYKIELQHKIDKFAEEIAKVICEYANELFGIAPVDISPNGAVKAADVSVSYSKEGDVYIVIAQGKEAYFVEFGAGVYFNEKPSPHPKGAELGMLIGQYGDGYGNRRVWGFPENGTIVLTRGTPASMPM